LKDKEGVGVEPDERGTEIMGGAESNNSALRNEADNSEISEVSICRTYGRDRTGKISILKCMND
jgi:hypothetical protein